MKAIYEVRLDSRVARELRRIPASQAQRMLETIESLSTNPRPRQSTKLVGQPGWRVRVGDYRILYEIDDEKNLVTVFRAGHRREVYR
jgi:mRNA interferase RelE/StbE